MLNDIGWLERHEMPRVDTRFELIQKQNQTKETMFDLSSISSGTSQQPPRIIIHGEHGIGKTTFASQAPSPVFVQLEDGLIGLPEAKRTSVAKSYGEFREMLVALCTQEHPYKTVVIDSVDWLEKLIWTKVASDGGKDSVEDFGYGKGYVLAEDVWRSDVLAGLDRLRERGIGIILIAHSQVRRFDDPMAESYDRFELKLHKRASAVLSEWADIVGFAHEKIMVRKDEAGFNKKRTRAKGSGQRVLGFDGGPSFQAKNRLAMPAEIPFTWSAFADAMSAL